MRIAGVRLAAVLAATRSSAGQGSRLSPAYVTGSAEWGQWVQILVAMAEVPAQQGFRTQPYWQQEIV